jgi:hypothetical protein
MQMRAMPKLSRWAPYAMLGPITGPLTWRLRCSLREHRPLLATLYAAAIVETYVVLPLVLADLLRVVKAS